MNRGAYLRENYITIPHPPFVKMVRYKFRGHLKTPPEGRVRISTEEIIKEEMAGVIVGLQHYGSRL